MGSNPVYLLSNERGTEGITKVPCSIPSGSQNHKLNSDSLIYTTFATFSTLEEMSKDTS